jgi:hypothetical protein
MISEVNVLFRKFYCNLTRSVSKSPSTIHGSGSYQNDEVERLLKKMFNLVYCSKCIKVAQRYLLKSIFHHIRFDVDLVVFEFVTWVEPTV